jgi:hypothetical protein
MSILQAYFWNIPFWGVGHKTPHIGEGLPGDDLGQLDQRMGGWNVDGHGLHTAGGVEPRETDAHEDAFSVACVLVRLTRDNEGIIVLAQLQPLTL